MNTKQKMWLGVCASLLVGAAALTTSSALSATEPQNDLLRANVEALTSNETTTDVKLQCEGLSPVIYCQVTCRSCRTVWRVIGVAGPAKSAIGKCSCGAYVSL